MINEYVEKPNNEIMMNMRNFLIIFISISGSITSYAQPNLLNAKIPEEIAASIEKHIIGFPQNKRMFLRGTRLLPPLAVIIATDLFIKLVNNLN